MNKHIFYGVAHYICRQIMRATVKSFLVVLVTFVMLLALGWLQETIDRNDAEITRLYESMEIFGHIVPVNPNAIVIGSEAGDFIRRSTLDAVVASELVIDIYFETTTLPVLVTTKNVEWEIMAEMFVNIDNDFELAYPWGVAGIIITPCLEAFINHHTSEPTIPIPGITIEVQAIEIEFDDGFDKTSFNYTDETLTKPVPVILSEQFMMLNGFNLGDIITIYNMDTWTQIWHRIPAVIIGTQRNAESDILMSLSAWEFAFPTGVSVHGTFGFTTLEFIVDPLLNQEIVTVATKLEEIIRFGGYTALELILHDEEVRFVARPLEQNVSLLWLLYPVVVIISLLIASSVAFFLTIQNAKNVATMRIFGASRQQVGLILWLEQIILCIVGLVLILILLIVLEWGFGFFALMRVTGLYLLSVMVGSIIGAIVVVRQSPLELLQVKE